MASFTVAAPAVERGHEPGSVSDALAAVAGAAAGELLTLDDTDDGILSVPDLVTDAADAGILSVALEPGLPGGFIHERYDLWLHGRVLATSRIEQIRLRIQEQVVGSIHYSRKAGGGTTILPDGTTATQWGFAFCVPRARDTASAPCAFTVETHTDSEATYSEAFLIAPDGGQGGSSTIVMGPVGPPSGELSPVRLYIERATVDHARHLLIQGWALSLSPLLTIQAFSGEERIGVAQFGRPRQDVAQVYHQYPNAASSGFAIQTRLDEATARITHVRVEAIDLHGCSHQVLHPVVQVETLEPLPAAEPARPAEPPPVVAAQPDRRRAIHMHCDEIVLGEDGRLTASGWALSGVGISSVEVRLDTDKVGEAELALPRPDVANEYAATPMAAFSGFRFAGTLGRPVAGDHTVTFVAHNGLDDLHTLTETATAAAVVEAPAAAAQDDQPAAPAAERMGFRLEVDMPAVTDGVVKQPVSGMLTLQGWALAHSGVASLDVLIDDEHKGEAHYGLSRPDVAGAFPHRDDALRSGFVFLCPLRGLEAGEHKVRLVANAHDGETTFREFVINVQKDDSKSSYAQIRRRLLPRHVANYRALLNGQAARPVFRVVVQVDRAADMARAEITVRSLRGQIYPDWHVLLLAKTAAVARAGQRLIDTTLQDLAAKITCVTTAGARGFGEPSDAPSGDVFYSFLSPGDELGCDALIEIALLNGRHAAADLIYADESRVCPTTHEREAFFKPEWSPDLLLSTNYIGRPWFVTADVLARSGVTPRSFVAEGEYSVVLRCTEAAAIIRRHPRLLCQRWSDGSETAVTEGRALKRAMERRGVAAEIEEGCASGIWRVRRKIVTPGLVSIIIPTCAARGYIKTCIETLRAKTRYRQFEIVCIDNIPEAEPEWKAWLKANSDKIVDIPEAFNWSRFNNLAAEQAAGEYLLFLNDDIEIIQDDWLDALMEHAQRPEIGIVGPQLLYPDRKVQHAGMFLSSLGTARHSFRMLPGHDPGYFGLALTQRNVIAVTGACMLMKRTHYDELGGFDEAHTVINNDLDYCLRAHAAGQLVIYTPHAALIHHELASRDKMEDVFDTTRFNNRWKNVFSAGDPYFSPRLSLHWDDYRPDDEPAQEIYVGHPIGQADEIQRILIAKLDHIGDFLTAIPAIQQLKADFPHASLHVLASRGAKPFAESIGIVDGFHEFDFFHARSGLGPKDLTEDDYLALGQRLAPLDFDLAIDLRMHPDTRVVLGHVPARFRAGYDHVGEFPFLDIALEWNKDSPLQRKHAHVSDALLNLVAAVATAFSPVPDGPILAIAPSPDVIQRLPVTTQALFQKRVVALHPGVGNTARQWPAEHFAALADLLVEKSGVNVVLIGGPDESELADQVLEDVLNKDAVESLAGKTSLRDLPLLLKACVLYIGNNSGPKHIAASLGVPTIGIHSGVVDAVEWGPLGNRAFALQRNMLCKPCYLLKADDCPRGMACLRQLEPATVYQYCETLLGATPQ